MNSMQDQTSVTLRLAQLSKAEQAELLNQLR
jgi:hypothetical protein